MTRGPILYVGMELDACGVLGSLPLGEITDRHRVALTPPPLQPAADPLAEARRHGCRTAIVELGRGWPGRRPLRCIRTLSGAGLEVLLHYSREDAVERVDRHRLRHLAKLFLVTTLYRLLDRGFRHSAARGPEFPRHWSETAAEDEDAFRIRMWTRLRLAIGGGRPIQPRDLIAKGDRIRVTGPGLYLRLDYWNQDVVGGGYGHTVYVAQGLDAACERLTCLVTSRFEDLDKLGVRQILVSLAEREALGTGERDILEANAYFYWQLKAAVAAISPSFIYERLVPGSWAGARIAKELAIPHYVEFNGSEAMIQRTFAGRPYTEERLFLAAEKAVLRQATVVNVVSQALVEGLRAMGVAPERILVNPNGADPAVFRPGSSQDRAGVRGSFGWTPGHCVVGFIGTFAGWHGIEILADALPRICRADPNIRFLLIGGGSLEHLVANAVEANGLADRVVMTGRIPQAEAVPLLQACDIFVSPHHRHMQHGRFFGSPTKLFEYMSVGGAIVASDFEQIGTVLRPAADVGALADPGFSVTDQRAILVQPGNAEQLVQAVLLLAKRPDLWAPLGRNARRAVTSEFSWDAHVQRLLAHVKTLAMHGKRDDKLATAVQNIDKAQIRAQWDDNPCGSHHGDAGLGPRDLAWFEAIERHRFVDYAPWMPDVMEFGRHCGEKVLEIGAGLGTDLARFAKGGAIVTDLDFSLGHLTHAKANFAARGLDGTFLQGDAEDMPFDDATFDLVYANGVIHHTPYTEKVVDEIQRVLRPSGRLICMVYSENSLHYWKDIIFNYCLRRRKIHRLSPNAVMSQEVEMSETDSQPLVKVYTAAKLREMFGSFERIEICKRQLTPPERPRLLRWLPASALQRVMGWNLIVKARKPALRHR